LQIGALLQRRYFGDVLSRRVGVPLTFAVLALCLAGASSPRGWSGRWMLALARTHRRTTHPLGPPERLL
jgi:hypothetical protein